MIDATLRGKCQEYAESAAAADPTLTVVRGWYHDPLWGQQEHWWTTRADGTIHDPTAAQFPVGGVPAFYEAFAGLYPCAQCGDPTPEADLYLGCCCSAECYGAMVGVPLSPQRIPASPEADAGYSR